MRAQVCLAKRDDRGIDFVPGAAYGLRVAHAQRALVPDGPAAAALTVAILLAVGQAEHRVRRRLAVNPTAIERRRRGIYELVVHRGARRPVRAAGDETLHLAARLR